MVQMLPYILPLLLGRTFDLNKMQVGVDIFPMEEIDRKVVISNPSTETHYKVIDKMEEVRNFLDVEGSFSINIKAGVFKAGASGQYLSDAYNRESTVEVAIKATYQTVTEQLPADAKPMKGWKLFGEGALGTHFVRSITYGGEVISAVRMECNNTRDKMKIKGALELGGRVEIFDLGLQVQGEYFKDVAKSIESTQIKVFSSIPLGRVPNDMESLKKALDGFPDDLQKFNEGRGIPLKMELWPLRFLDSSRLQRSRNKLLEVAVDDFEKKFDDLINTKTAIADWLKILEKPLTEDQEKRIGDYYETLEKTTKEFYRVIGSLDMSKGVDQLKPANAAYGSNVPGTFFRKYLSLRQDIAADQGDWGRSKGMGVTYTHWGGENCSDLAEKMLEGTVTGPRGFGGGADFLCMPKDSKLGDPATKLRDATITHETSLKYSNEDASQLVCSECLLRAKGSVQVYPGAQTCPNSWDYVYEGLLVSGSQDSAPTSFLCLDKNMNRNDIATTLNSTVVPNWVQLISESTKTQRLYPCIVCAS